MVASATGRSCTAGIRSSVAQAEPVEERHPVNDGLCDSDVSSFPSFFLRNMTSTTTMDTTAKAPQTEPKTMAKFYFFDLADDGSKMATEPELKCIFMISIPFRMGPRKRADVLHYR